MRRSPVTLLILALAVATASCSVATESSGRPDDDPEVDLVAIDDPSVEPEVIGEEPDPADSPDEIVVPSGDLAVIYLLVDAPSSSGYSDGLIPVARPLAVLSAPVTDLAATTIGFLLAGPTTTEREGEIALSSAIPADTRLLGLTVADGVASIDLSGEFAAPGGTYGEAARVEQVVFTLTRLPDIERVAFSIDGEPVDWFGGHGIDLREPIDRTALQTAVPSLLIESPARWDVTPSPVTVAGSSDTTIESIRLALADQHGAVLWEGAVTPNDCGPGCRADWQVEIPYEVDEDQIGVLGVWTTDPAGAVILPREHQVFLITA